jgi:osomolarity two-component system sensor histidine kinase NIK1
MGTSPAPPPPPADPFKDHLLAVLSLHDAPRAAAAPIPRYSGPRDWQTDAILRKIEALMKRAPSPAAKTNGASHSPTTPPAASNKAQSTPTPTLASLPAVNGYSRSASPDSEASYNTALEDDGYPDFDFTSSGPLTCPQCGHRPLHFPGIDYAESPGVVPTGGALANAATQGGMDALEELRLLKDQVRFFPPSLKVWGKKYNR